MSYSLSSFIVKTEVLFIQLQHCWFFKNFLLKYTFLKRQSVHRSRFHTLTHSGKSNKLIDIIDFAFHFVHAFKIILVWVGAILDWRVLKETLYMVIMIFNFSLRSNSIAFAFIYSTVLMNLCNLCTISCNTGTQWQSEKWSPKTTSRVSIILSTDLRWRVDAGQNPRLLLSLENDCFTVHRYGSAAILSHTYVHEMVLSTQHLNTYPRNTIHPLKFITQFFFFF